MESAVDFVKTHPGMFLKGEYKPQEVADLLVRQAFCLGVKLKVNHVNEWIVLESDSAWIDHYSFDDLTVNSLAGPNSMKYEILVNAFAANFIVKQAKQTLIKDVTTLDQIDPKVFEFIEQSTAEEILAFC